MDNPMAFPSVETHPNEAFPMHHFGMTLRDWFAGQALAGALATDMQVTADFHQEVAKFVYASADALLAVRAQQ